MRIMEKFGLGRIVILLVCFTCFSINAHSQFNVKIGYSLGFVSPEVNNQILAKYNEQRATFFDELEPMEDVKFLYGIALGARYKFGIGALELNWESMSRTRTSIGKTLPPEPEISTSNSKEYKYSLNMLMLTYESSFGILGVGSSIGNNLVAVKEKIQTSNESSQILQEDNRSQLFARFHLSFNFTGNGTVSFAIKPFYQLPLTTINLQPMAERFDVQNDTYDEGFPMFGISFTFYNGRQ